MPPLPPWPISLAEESVCGEPYAAWACRLSRLAGATWAPGPLGDVAAALTDQNDDDGASPAVERVPRGRGGVCCDSGRVDGARGETSPAAALAVLDDADCAEVEDGSRPRGTVPE